MADLAVRDFTDQELKRRIEAASKPGFGLADATSAQLNMIYLLGQRYQVDPITDITLFQGRPHFTIDGRVRLMRRHPQYRGYRCRPLSAEEKAAWNYGEGDIVVECSITTRDWGEIAARGKVTPAERQRQTPTGTHPQEMAEKRAIARASRLAFGQDVPDEDEAGVVLLEQNDPARTAALAQQYDELFGTEADHDALPLPKRPSGGNQPPRSAPGEHATPPARPADLERSRLWAERRQQEIKGGELGIPVRTLNSRLATDELTTEVELTRAQIKAVEEDLVAEPEEQESLV